MRAIDRDEAGIKDWDCKLTSENRDLWRLARELDPKVWNEYENRALSEEEPDFGSDEAVINDCKLVAENRDLWSLARELDPNPPKEIENRLAWVVERGIDSEESANKYCEFRLASEFDRKLSPELGILVKDWEIEVEKEKNDLEHRIWVIERRNITQMRKNWSIDSNILLLAGVPFDLKSIPQYLREFINTNDLLLQ